MVTDQLSSKSENVLNENSYRCQYITSHPLPHSSASNPDAWPLYKPVIINGFNFPLLPTNPATGKLMFCGNAVNPKQVSTSITEFNSVHFNCKIGLNCNICVSFLRYWIAENYPVSQESLQKLSYKQLNESLFPPSHFLKVKYKPSYRHCHIIREAGSRSTQPCIPPGSLNRVPASAGVRAGMSPLPGGRLTLCDPMWHVSSRSGVATLRTAIHLLLTYLLTMQLSGVRPFVH